jgi:hypothetical protein
MDNDFTWDKDSVNKLAQDVAEAHRKMRRILDPYGGKPGWTIDIVRRRTTSQSPLTVLIEERRLIPVFLLTFWYSKSNSEKRADRHSQGL